VCNLAIEDCLVGKLSGLFTATLVLDMDEVEVGHLAGESSKTTKQRIQFEEKQVVLGAGLEHLKGFSKRSRSPAAPIQDVASEFSEDQMSFTSSRSSRQTPFAMDNELM
jgi:hypothetical protein